MATGFVSTTTGLVKSLGRLVGASVRASGKAMDSLSTRLHEYAEDKDAPGAHTPPITPNPPEPPSEG
ncbi:MAG: hypothetical protein LBK95_07060 [Bifidobacteriaceae bacterium]|jgi:hypothetical protein|nr:hypothetical protein [Bifidobacteriaceae bacterium]